MRKSTKIISTVIALVLVVSAMIIGIYAATSSTSQITAAITWSSTDHVAFTLDGYVINDGTTTATKTMTQVVVNGATTNTGATGIERDLGTSFVAKTGTDGVNKVHPIKFTYTIKNTATTSMQVRLTKYPAQASESGTAGTASSHKPTVAWSATNNGSAVTYANAIASAGVIVSAGKSYIINITLSLADGGVGTINADTGISSFDAGVTFAFAA